MSRAIDLCTCNHDRKEHDTEAGCYHINLLASTDVWCNCKQFFPHPQPPVEPHPKRLDDDLWEFLNTYSGGKLARHARAKYDKTIMVTAPTGELWEINITKRSKD